MHTIHVDRCKRMILVRHDGFYDVAGIQHYYRDLLDTLLSQFGPDPDYVIMLDISRCQVQSQEAIRALQDGLGQFPPARKIAVVAEGALARMQMRRIISRDYLRNFDAASDAIRWLEAA